MRLYRRSGGATGLTAVALCAYRAVDVLQISQCDMQRVPFRSGTADVAADRHSQGDRECRDGDGLLPGSIFHSACCMLYAAWCIVRVVTLTLAAVLPDPNW